MNWWEQDDEGRSKRARLRMEPDQSLALFQEPLEERRKSALPEGNDEWKFCCPFHDDTTPSCNFNPRKDCFRCFACPAKGTGRTLFYQLQRGRTKAETIQRIAEKMGKSIEYIDPDSKAEAIYNYLSEKGNLLKQVLRYRDDEGNKSFRQRRPGKDGPVWSVRGLPPMLYNARLLQFNYKICITEGEKDADAVTALNLYQSRGRHFGRCRFLASEARQATRQTPGHHCP